jgi:hypothetical protein
MRKYAGLLMAFLVLALLVAGCQKGNIVEPKNSGWSMPQELMLPGVTLDSAMFSIYVADYGFQTVNIHRITADWAELTVTWNSFNESFDPAIIGSFTANTIGWQSVNITSLVQGWVDGTYPNYGILLEQGMTNPTIYYSSEYSLVGFRPILRICYTTSEGPQCVSIQRGTNGDVADDYIVQTEGDLNLGFRPYLYTGADRNQQALLKFGLPETPPPPSGCTRTIGYWKTHAGFDPPADVVTPLLPIWLGTPGGTKSIDVTTATIAHNILLQNVYGTAKNGITKLYAQLLGAKLSIASGADNTAVDPTIALADAFLATHNYQDWNGLSKADKQTILVWQSIFDDYNNGLIGPIHCLDTQ